ncbi:hypothetical protein BGY98DRAFT_968389, partial [Russula aff. rugulosa BPL654]
MLIVAQICSPWVILNDFGGAFAMGCRWRWYLARHKRSPELTTSMLSPFLNTSDANLATAYRV